MRSGSDRDTRDTVVQTSGQTLYESVSREDDSELPRKRSFGGGPSEEV